MTAGSFDAGTTTGIGQIGLAGALTELSVTGSATVGDGGTGLAVGAWRRHLRPAGLTLGAQSNGTGDLIVLDQNSLVELTGALNIGSAAGIGDVTVGQGASIVAPVVNLENGQAILKGGLLDPLDASLIGTTASGFGTIGANFVIDEGKINCRTDRNSIKSTLGGAGHVTGWRHADDRRAIRPSRGPPRTVRDCCRLAARNAGGDRRVLNAATTFTDTQGGTYQLNNSVIDVTFQDATGVVCERHHRVCRNDRHLSSGRCVRDRHHRFAVEPGVSNGNTLTVQDSGTGGTDQIIFASPINPASLAIVNGNTIVGGTTIVNGSTLEISGGPYVLTNFDGSGQPQYSTLLMSPASAPPPMAPMF